MRMQPDRYTHIVLFTLNDPLDGPELVERLYGMAGQIPSLKQLEAGVDDAPSPRSAHVSLITRFDSAEGLAAYQVHPAHVALLAWVRPRVKATIKVDYAS